MYERQLQDREEQYLDQLSRTEARDDWKLMMKRGREWVAEGKAMIDFAVYLRESETYLDHLTGWGPDEDLD